jgi:CTP synthase
MQTKFIIVAGGVISGVGKGVTTASLAKILLSYGYKTTCIKIDPYINIDAGTMNPTEHGEVFVTDDGDETDQDIGNYERFLNQNITSANYMTTGRVYKSVIEKERRLEYQGKCVEVVPHIPHEVIARIKRAAEVTEAEFVVIEVGGTVGEYQNVLFLEAARMMHLQNPDDVVFVLVSYLPVPKKLGEMKTKPTQYATITLNSKGIQPDFIVCRSEYELDDVRRTKIATFCNIKPEEVISTPDVDFIYEVPIILERERFGEKILKKFGLQPRKNTFDEWKSKIAKIKTINRKTKIGIVGKYFDTGDFTLSDSYLSVIEAVKHAAWVHDVIPDIEWIDSQEFERNHESIKLLNHFAGIIVPGGFGSRGVEGKLSAIKFCRENKIPFLGICYGMQLAVVEFARNVCKLDDAHTTEISPSTPHPVITLQPSQHQIMNNGDYGGTMRLGAYTAALKEGSQVFNLYKDTNRMLGDQSQISKIESFRKGKTDNLGNVVLERHRHRYEVNPEYIERLQKQGMIFSGQHIRDDGIPLMEFLELQDGNFRGTQGHPEFKSRLEDPSPLFLGFIQDTLRFKSQIPIPKQPIVND